MSGECPSRPVLFEMGIRPHVFFPDLPHPSEPQAQTLQDIKCFHHLGYDHAMLGWRIISQFLLFPTKPKAHKQSISLNDGGLIHDEESFASYPWPDPYDKDYSIVNEVARELPSGMKFGVMAPMGMLENTIALVGFENLCFMLADEPDLVRRITDQIGKCLYRYYERLLEFDAIGFCFVNDDWGFKTATMISPLHLREYIFPWQKKFARLIHDAGRKAILHSCGYMSDVWDDIIDDMKFDAKHSFEDQIHPIEQAYEQLNGRIALLGGLDVDYLCRETPEAVYKRSKEMLERAKDRGGYALGSGNSIADYLNSNNCRAMIRAAVEG